jgi:type IV secretion system protein VirD4
MDAVTRAHVAQRARWLPVGVGSFAAGALVAPSLDLAGSAHTSTQLVLLIAVLAAPVAVMTLLAGWWRARSYGWVPALLGLLVGGIVPGGLDNATLLGAADTVILQELMGLGLVVWLALLVLSMVIEGTVGFLLGPVVAGHVRHLMARPGTAGQADLLGHPVALEGAPVVATSPTALVLGLRTSDGQVVTSRGDAHMLALGPTRSGKTSGLIATNVLTFAGSVVALSTKGDLLTATAAQRATTGPVWLLDPLHVVADHQVPFGVIRLHWTPLRGCQDWNVARARAADIAGAANTSNVSNADHWRIQGERLIAPLLHAAALTGRTMCDVVTWSAGPESAGVVVDKLTDLGAAEAAGWLAAVLGQEPRHRDSVFATLASVMHVYAGDVLAEAAAARAEEWDPAAFLADGRGTLYIVAPKDALSSDPGPIVAGFLGELHATLVRVSSQGERGSLSVPTMWALDEVANICPLPALPHWLSEATGRGLICLLGVQDTAQLEQRWTEHGARSLLTNCAIKAVCPGVTDPATLHTLETIGGEKDTWRATFTQGRPMMAGDGASPGSSDSSSRTVTKEPRWSRSAIAGLEPATVLLYQAGREPELLRQARYYAPPFAAAEPVAGRLS